MSIKRTYTKAAIALIMIFGLSFLMVSCVDSRNTHDSALAGYGHASKAIKGPKR